MSGVTRMSLSRAPTQWSWISSKDAILSLEDKKTLRSFTVNILWISLNYLVILIERSSPTLRYYFFWQLLMQLSGCIYDF